MRRIIARLMRYSQAAAMKQLPIYEIEQQIVSSLKASGRLVLQAPTGSGKSTQVPQMLFRHGLLGDGRAVILQPRRLAARLLASRVAQEMKVQRSEERRVGKECRSRWAADHEKKKER